MRDLLEALKFMTAFAASHSGDGCKAGESALVDVMLEDPGNLQRTIDMARAAIARATSENYIVDFSHDAEGGE